MIEIIGTKNCSKCTIVKKILDEKHIVYYYLDINDISAEEKEWYMNLAKKANQKNFPLIIKEGKIITIEEI